MMMRISTPLLLLVAFILNVKAENCDDSPLKVLLSQKMKSARTCMFIAKHSDKYCKRRVIQTHCPDACGVCNVFGTSNSEGFFVFEGKKRDCAWLLDLPDFSEVSYWCDIDAIRATCRHSCSYFCAAEPTSSPSSSPSTTSKPSSVPSQSQAPSDELCFDRIVSLIESKFGEVMDESPQKRALDWLRGDIDGDDCDDQSTIIQRYVLAVLYYSTNGHWWKYKTEWLGSKHVCKWRGLQCNKKTKQLTRLDLSNNWLEGTIPSEISALDTLELLFLHENGWISGTIPNTIGDMVNLRSFWLKKNWSMTGLREIKLYTK